MVKGVGINLRSDPSGPSHNGLPALQQEPIEHWMIKQAFGNPSFYYTGRGITMLIVRPEPF